MPRSHRFFAIPAVAAVLSMTAMPLAAADIAPAPSHPNAPADAAWSEAAQTAHQYRRHGWDRHRHRHRDRGVDAGDVVAGVLILGGIAAIATAIKNDRERDYRDREVRHPDDYRYREGSDGHWRDDDDRDDWRGRSGLDNAASICVGEVEREARVDRVDAVDRDASGWEVRGTLSDGAGFICRIGSDGRIADVDYSLRRDRPVYGEETDDRWDDYGRD